MSFVFASIKSKLIDFEDGDGYMVNFLFTSLILLILIDSLVLISSSL